jgi:hypothetical protein
MLHKADNSQETLRVCAFLNDVVEKRHELVVGVSR